MLKNMKVRTKLIAVLLAPVLVLVLLATIGVGQRLSVASDAQRVQELAEMAQTSANLAHELQVEAYYSAAYMASGGSQWAAEKDGQRAKTDEARKAYESAINRINPAKDSEDLKKAAGAVDDRLKNLDTQRRSVDGVETEAPTAIKQFSDISKALADLDTSIAQATDDPKLARGLNTFANLNRLEYTQANEAALLVAVSQIGFFPSTWPTPARPTAVPCENAQNGCDIYTKITAAAADVVQQTTIYNQAADGTQKQYLRDATAGKDLASVEKAVIETGTVDIATLNATNAVPTETGIVRWSPKLTVNPQGGKYTELVPAKVVTAAIDQNNALKASGDSIISTVLSDARKLRTDAQQAATLYLVFAIGAIAIALIAAFYVARAVTVPLKKLTTAAYSLSTDKLPALIDRLRNPDEASGSLSETLTPIDIRSKDEIGQLADAFNSIQHVTVEVAEEQGALLRKGIGDIFINLARRNQTLLDRQIEFIDQLEANEEDPDQLDNLFKLDHLATRMRRNAESLLVLAGAEPPRRRGRPVALADVVRVAIGEVEDFARISLLALDDVTVGGNVAVDLAHLLSELMENATHFSPPDTTVEIVGHRSETGYTLSVSDQGIGMSADQLSEANNQLARPPLVGLALSRSLGFIVIGRLSARFGIEVKLTASPSGGVSALVTLPGELVSIDGQPMVAPAPEATESGSGPAPAPAPARAEVVVIDPETDAAIEADGAAGRELELEEFEQTLAQADFEDEVRALEAEVASPTDQDEIDITEDVETPQAALVDDAETLSDELEEEPSSYLEAVPEGDEFERGLQSLVSDELAPGPVEREPGRAPAEPGELLSDDDTVPGAFGSAAVVDDGPSVAPIAEEASAAAVEEAPSLAVVTPVEAAPAELTAAGLVKRTPKKKAEDASGGGMSMSNARGTGASQRSPEEVRKMLSRYRSGLNKGRGGADETTSDTNES